METMKKYTTSTYTKLLNLAKSKEHYETGYAPEGKEDLIECSYIKKLLNSGYTVDYLVDLVNCADDYFSFMSFYLYERR